MKRFFVNITTLILIITTLNIISCSDVSKSYCEEILNYSYTENDTLTENNISLARKCSEKYHKRPEYLQKISQIYYSNAISEYSSEHLITATKELFTSLEYINEYFSKIETVKSFDYQFRGEIYERLADIYKDINSLKPASELYDKALADYESSGNIEKALNTLIKTGKLYQYNHIPNIAMIYFEIAEEYEDIPLNIHRKIIDNKIITLYELNDYKNADSLFRNHFNIKIQDYDFHSAIGTKYFYERNYKDALPHLIYSFENGNQQEKLSASEKLAETYYNLKDHENEMFYIQHQAKNNSIEIRRTPLKLDLEKLFDTNISIINNQKIKDSNNYNIAVLIVFAAAIAIVILLYLHNRKKYQEKIRNAEKTINDNHEKIQNKDKIIDNISKKIEDLESSKANVKFEDAYVSFSESNIYRKIKSHMEGRVILIKNIQENSKLALSNNDIITLVKTFNKHFPNSISCLKNDYESLTSSDTKFIILSFMNLNDIEIAVLLGLTYSASNKRSKKIKDIFNIKSDLSDFIIQYTKSKF
ncbi:MAG: hypothetical protein IKY27_08340 [Bacteroidales bacterium]|nr:hypothetical protein [Bacteroidales bacterium]